MRQRFDRDLGRRAPVEQSVRSGSSPADGRCAQCRLEHGSHLHADDSDTTQLVKIWRNELFGEHGARNDTLIGAET